MKKNTINESEEKMSPEVETKLRDLLEDIKATTDVQDMSFEQVYLLVKQKIKEKQIPAEIYYDSERLDPKCLWILDVSELQKSAKMDNEGGVKYIQGGWRVI